MAKDYLNAYKKRTPKFQAGGEMAPEQAPAQGGAPDLEGMLMQYAETRDPQLAVAICDTLVEQLSAAQGQQPMPAARKGGRMNSSAPMFKKGGKLKG
jgi:hypothetical protein